MGLYIGSTSFEVQEQRAAMQRMEREMQVMREENKVNMAKVQDSNEGLKNLAVETQVTVTGFLGLQRKTNVAIQMAIDKLNQMIFGFLSSMMSSGMVWMTRNFQGEQ
jgi:primosomal replication protein N